MGDTRLDDLEQSRFAREHLDTVWEKYRDDQRFRRIIDGMVSLALTSVRHIEPEPDQLDRDRYEVAIRAASLVLAQIYEGDAEIVTLRAEVAHYKKVAEHATMISPMPIFLANLAGKTSAAEAAEASHTPPTGR